MVMIVCHWCLQLSAAVGPQADALHVSRLASKCSIISCLTFPELAARTMSIKRVVTVVLCMWYVDSVSHVLVTGEVVQSLPAGRVRPRH